jgi:hypothetical protein
MVASAFLLSSSMIPSACVIYVAFAGHHAPFIFLAPFQSKAL